MKGRVASSLILALLFSSADAAARPSIKPGDSYRERRTGVRHKATLPPIRRVADKRTQRAAVTPQAVLPAIETGGSNPVPACATPGRLMAFATSRNGNLDARFAPIATEYMRHGKELGVRWDYAFFQMLLETGNLSFKRGNGQFGDVKPSQNNFAGIGATGGGVRGESFPDVTTGVKAHLQHLLLYAGRRIDTPVAERTRQVQEWGVLTSWQERAKKPITFTDLTLKWAKDPRYASSIESVANRFYDAYCDRPDPQPELVQEARSGRGLSVAAAEAADDRAPDTAPANKEVDPDDGGDSAPSGLGAAELAKSDEELASQAPLAEPIEDAELAPPSRHMVDPSPAKRRMAVQSERPAMVKTAAATMMGTRAAPTRCRVWTASYGGQRAIIIKAVADQHTNYTVLDVNEGAEGREAEAYIEAYAKGGQQVGEFANQSQALERAFEFCPEG
jgi:Mannosyl-glycoprotein endo-beta-N-acetylglucosaminidase